MKMVENAEESSYDHTKNQVLSAPKQWFSECLQTAQQRLAGGKEIGDHQARRCDQPQADEFSRVCLMLLAWGGPVSPMIFSRMSKYQHSTEEAEVHMQMWIYILQYVMCVSNGIHCKEKRRCWSRCNTCCPNLKILFLFGGVGSPLSTTSAVTDHHTPLPGALPCCWATWRGYKRFARHQCGVSYLHIQWMQRGWSYTSEEVYM